MLLGATAGVLAGTTGVLASTTGLPFVTGTACGCGVEPLPNETTIEGFNTIVEGEKESEKEVPVINWEQKTPITTKGCKGGKVVISVEAENTETHKFETRESTLTESPAGSGKFAGEIPVMHPLHGKASLKITVSGCEHSAEDIVVVIVIYIDPSGKVVDGNHEDAPVWEATVTLLSSATKGGTYTAVPNGSTVMSPSNRTNPDKTRENGSFGWETVAGFYEVEASKTGCGTATTSAFEIPPPVENLEIVLHCEGEQWKIGEEGAEKPQLAVTAPTKRCEGKVRVENVSFGTVSITILKETGIECTVKTKACETKKLNKVEECESELEKPGTKPEYELEVEWKGKKFTRKFPV
ncbi:MAG TPA: carboxypeptidase-like regulatory domain-containing protein [Solirubrobacteraceae bacterium]